MEPNASSRSISSRAEKYSSASSTPISRRDPDEDEELRLELEHLEDVVLPSAMPTEPLVAIPEPSPFSPNQIEEVKTDDSVNAGLLFNFDRADTALDDDKSAKYLMFHGSTTWSMGYFSELSCGRGDLWRERSIWHRSEAPKIGGMQPKQKEAKKLNETGGHSCGVLFWAW